MRTRLLLIVAALHLAAACAVAAPPEAAVEQAHTEIWRRFVDRHGVFLDFTDLDGAVDLPTPEECRDGKPNALGWWSPIENGAMFNGLYMDGALQRWQHTRRPADADKARRLMEGLLFLNSVSDVEGFVARGASTDGRSHYPMGSNDQTLPWLTGLWQYHQSDLATPDEKTRISKHLVRTAEVIAARGWTMPAEPPFGTRGTFEGFHFEEVARKLFTLKMLHALTSDAKWDALYRAELEGRGAVEASPTPANKAGDKPGRPAERSKRDICETGMAFFYAKTHNWTSCAGVGALRQLWELESDPGLKASYAKGLAASARLAAESLPLALEFDPDDRSVFVTDWRTSMLPLWQPQKTEHEAVKLAEQQLRAFLKVSPRRQKETAFIREPTSAAWIVTLCPDKEVVRPHSDAIRQVVGRYDYSNLYYSTFFWVEGAWWRLQAL